MEKFKNFLAEEQKSLLILLALFVINLGLFGLHLTNIYMDMGREFYFPQAVLNGEVLYKDIFNIFGPFSYMLNALLYKFFGVNFSVIYGFSALNSFFIVLMTYLVSRKFLDKFPSLIISIFLLEAGCHSFGFSTLISPYTFAITYGLSFLLLSVYLFLNFLENDKKFLLYLSFFFSGCAASNKYEFAFLPLLLFIFLVIYKKQDLKTYLLSVFSALIMPITLFGILFSQGLNIKDLVEYTKVLIAYSASTPLKILYKNIGIYPTKISLKQIMFSLGSLFFGSSLFLRALTLKKKGFYAFSFLVVSVLFIYLFIKENWVFLSAIVLLNTVLAVIRAKEIIKNPKLCFLTAATILFSVKTFFNLQFYSGYGLFAAGLNLIVLTILLKVKKEENTAYLRKAFSLVLCILALMLFWFHLNMRNATLERLIFPKASFYSSKNVQIEANEIYNSIPSNKTVIFLPEGQFLNFITNTKSDNYYNIFSPDRLQAYGEKSIIEHYRKTMPDYFVLINIDYILYGYEFICRDYGQDLCRWISENYKLEKTLKYDRSILIFKKI